MFDNHISTCISPSSGSGKVNLFSTCPLRLVRILPNGQIIQQNLTQTYCMLSGDDAAQPRSQNHNEYAFDSNTGIVYLRTIQNGQVVPSCYRALHITGNTL